MTSADTRDKGERVGFEIKEIATGKQGILAHKQEAVRALAVTVSIYSMVLKFT